MSFGGIANAITSLAVEKGCKDNVTLLIVDLHDYYLKYHKRQ
jgi:hypothetical protein